MSPLFPLYIPSKGRHEFMVTSKALTAMNVAHYIVAEPDEVGAYDRAVGSMGLSATVLTLDLDYKAKYELCDTLGLSKSTGPGPARNFAWDHSIAEGHAWHWVMDDNIKRFIRLNNNVRMPTRAASFWRAMEDFALRYKNVAMAGPNYRGFVAERVKYPPFSCNTRIYSCNLIRNDVPFRWRGRYNEDTILSLDMLKAGWCTIQYYAFLQDKMVTQSLAGGNTAEFYHAEGTVQPGERYADTGTVAKSKMLVRVHPDVSKLAIRYGRVHHHVDYRPFKRQKLIRKSDAEIPLGVNNYGMQLKVKGLAADARPH